MEKRNYTHIQALLPEIKAMLAEGKTQREIAEHYGYRDKQVVKELLKRERRKERKSEAGILPRPKGRPRKDATPRELWQSRLMRFGGCAWKISCCGIFCNSQEGSESKGKVCGDLPPQERVPHTGYVQILFGVQKRVLQLCKTDEPAGKGCCPCRNDSTAARQMLSHLRLSENVAMAEEKRRNLPQSQDNPACYAKYGLLAEIRRRRKWQQMGQQVHKYENLLNRDFHAEAPNSKWVTDISYIKTKQGVLYLSVIRDLYDNSIVASQDGNAANGKPSAGHHPPGSAQRKKKVAAELQLHSDQGAQYASQAYFELTQTYGITPSMSRRGNPYDNAMAENFFFHPQNRMHLPSQTSYLFGSERDD